MAIKHAYGYFGGYVSRRQHQSLWLCFLAALASLQVNRSGSPLTQSYTNMMAREGLDLRYRLTTTAADKASVFTEFMAEAREEEEAAGRRRRRRARGG